MPSASTAIVRGPFNGVPSSGAPSGVGCRSPVPANVSIRAGRQIDAPDAVIADVADQQPPFRIDGDAVRLAQLRAVAGPPSPENPATPVPANVEMTPVFAINFPDDMVVALGDVQMAGGVELDFVRHVQRRRRGRSAIAAVAPSGRRRRSSSSAA